MTRTFPICSAC